MAKQFKLDTLLKNKAFWFVAVIVVAFFMFQQYQEFALIGAAYDANLAHTTEPADITTLVETLAAEEYDGVVGSIDSSGEIDKIVWGDFELLTESAPGCNAAIDPDFQTALADEAITSIKTFNGLRFIYFIDQDIIWCDETDSIKFSTTESGLKDLYFNTFVEVYECVPTTTDAKTCPDESTETITCSAEGTWPTPTCWECTPEEDVTITCDGTDVTGTCSANGAEPTCEDLIECTEDADCDSGEVCTDNACVVEDTGGDDTGSGSTGGTTCTESWNCTTWSTCTDGTQTRTCTDDNSCGTEDDKPIVTRSCTVPKEGFVDFIKDNPFLITLGVVVIIGAILAFTRGKGSKRGRRR
jgi:hypothetical protein